MEDKENQQDNKITKLETCFEFMNEKLLNIEKMVIAFDGKLDKALEKKADKWVEKVLVGLGSVVGLSFLTYLGTLIYKATIHLN